MTSTPPEQTPPAVTGTVTTTTTPTVTTPPATPPVVTEPAKTEDPPKGFPPDTPRADMKAAEQLAYDAYHGRKHEQRAKDYRDAAGGLEAADVKAKLARLAELEKSNLSEGEKAVADARVAGAREASLKLAPQMLDVALRHVPEERRKVLISNVDLTRVITEDGTVDTAKVTEVAEALAPNTGKGQGSGQRDYGQGSRSTGNSGGSGVAAGAARFAEKHKKQTTS